VDGPVLQTVIGLVFIFAVFAGLVSMVTEGVARFIGLRGEYLLRGIRTLVDTDNNFELTLADCFRRNPPKDKPGDKPPPETPALVSRLMSHALISPSAAGGKPPAEAGNTKLTRTQRKALPAYVSGRSFASALLAVVVPDKQGETAITELRSKLTTPEYAHLSDALLPLVNQAEGDIEKLRTSIERWYDDHMARVSGWYKRHVRWISLGLALLFAAVFNLNAIEIGRTLYSDEAVRAQVVQQAQSSTVCTADEDQAACLGAIRKAESAGIPFGWATAEACTVEGVTCTWYEKASFVPVDADTGEVLWALVMLLFGIVLMASATIPGARFWFDSLSKLGSLRSTGPKPATSHS
jgi:hypothetical protein